MIFKDFVIYSPIGEIIRTGNVPEDLVEDQAVFPGESAMVGTADYKTECVVVIEGLPVITLKAAVLYTTNKLTILADALDEFILSGLPNPCTVVWPDDELTEITDGQIEYSVDYPGTYKFTIKSPIHLDTEVIIEAIAAS